MNLDEFKRLTKVVVKNEAENLRNQYIHRLVNTSKECFKKHIEDLYVVVIIQGLHIQVKV